VSHPAIAGENLPLDSDMKMSCKLNFRHFLAEKLLVVMGFSFVVCQLESVGLRAAQARWALVPSGPGRDDEFPRGSRGVVG